MYHTAMLEVMGVSRSMIPRSVVVKSLAQGELRSRLSFPGAEASFSTWISRPSLGHK